MPKVSKSMRNTIIIYGATGYTGRLVSEQAKQVGLQFEVAGRDANKIRALAVNLGVPGRIFPVDDDEELRSSLAGCVAVLNCAGPFARTSRQIMQACLDLGLHYLDITAEFRVFELAESLSNKATSAGVMLMPGVGWDVVPSDCLAVHTARRIKAPQRLRIALQVAGSMSRGSAASAGEIIGVGVLT
jgi:short subunit dehydrogenase-like uncharacterized protein